jgi:hypothetical protein
VETLNEALNIAAIDVVEVAATSDLDSDAESQDGADTDYYYADSNSAANNYGSSSSSQQQRVQSSTGNGGSNGYVQSVNVHLLVEDSASC